MNQDPPVTPELLLAAYASGYFPMANSRKSRQLYWFSPERRGILPLDHPQSFHIPRSLQKFLRQNPFGVTFNHAFGDVIRACAETRNPKRDSTWINAEIEALYNTLHRMGHAHSVECWEAQKLVGGVYGVSLGGAFFGESMFSVKTNASKVALVHLVQHLQKCGYTLLDAQFENAHLTQFGFRGVPQESYLDRLDSALKVSPNPSSFFAGESVIRD